VNQKTYLPTVVLIIVMLFITAGVTSCECGSPRNISVDVLAPLHVMKGEEFIFEVRVENTAERSQLLYSIDIWDEYLRGISIHGTEPPFTDCYHVPIDNTHCYEFKKDIPAKGDLIITFYAVGTKAGDYSSYLDVCIGTSTCFLTHHIITTVED
jgi:hypothetical protein